MLLKDGLTNLGGTISPVDSWDKTCKYRERRLKSFLGL